MRTWGKWEAVDEQPLERSAMSNVWRVRMTGAPDRRPTHALKEMRYEKGRGSTAYKRFVREIEILAQKLHGAHGGIVEVTDHAIPADGDETEPYYVMPLARSSLQRAKNLKGKLEVVLEIALQVADALGAAHAVGVVHRDVKPGNVLLFDDELRAAVCDFGICYLEEDDRLTRAEADTIGTRDFVAPELHGGGRSQEVTPAADVYSLGKTIFAVVAGGDVFPREWMNDSRFDLATRFNDPRLRHLTGMMELMVTERAADRLQTMAEARELIERVLENLRHGTEYIDGLYRTGGSPIERLRGFQRVADSAASVKRSDALHARLDAAVENARARAQQFEVEEKSLRMPVETGHPKAAELARQCAEQLLAVGLPLVIANERDLYDEWLGSALDPLQRKDGYEYMVSRMVLAPAGVLAAYATGALALKHRRFEILRSVIDASASIGSRWTHHDILGDNVSKLEPWIEASVANSAMMKEVDPAIVVDATKWVRIVSGLTAVRLARNVSSEQFKTLQADIFGPGFPIPFLPGLVHVSWLSDLMEMSISKPPFERELAKVVFGLTPEQFRLMFRELTPILVLLHRSVMGRLHRVPYLALGLDLQRWKSWTGYDQPLVVL